MTIITNNGSNPSYTTPFDDLIQETFGFSFEPWLKRNLWDHRYESYSIIENGKMQANACIFKTDMLVQGKPVRAHQFGAIATRENQRGKGLSRLLMNHILDKYPTTPAFLAANKSVADYYQQYGFRPLQTYRPIIDIAINNSIEIICNTATISGTAAAAPIAPATATAAPIAVAPIAAAPATVALTSKSSFPPATAIKCTPDDPLVHNALNSNRIRSNILDSLNTQSVEIFHMLLTHDEDIYYLPSCNAIAVAEQEEETLYLANVLSASPITLESLAKQLPFKGITRIEFGFNPDWLGITPTWQPSEELYFIKGWTLPDDPITDAPDMPSLPKHFRFPAMSQT